MLRPDGRILFQYLEMIGEVDSTSIGIESSASDAYLMIDYLSGMAHDSLAVLIEDPSVPLTETPPSGVLPQAGSQMIDIRFDAAGLDPGTEFSYDLVFYSNDPVTPEFTVPVYVRVGTPSGISEGTAVPAVFRLHACEPNPFNPRTRIPFELPRKAAVNLAVYDVTGGRVVQLLQGREYPAGRHHVFWDGRDKAGRKCAAGVYFYRFEAESFLQTQKMVLLK